jgi:hypothetical protein
MKPVVADRDAMYDALHPMHDFDPTATYEPPQWLVEGMLILKGVNGIFGFEKAGKSRILNWILVAALNETPVGDCPTKHPGRILYLCGEETFARISVRSVRYADLMGIKAPGPKDVTFIDPAAGMRLERPDYRGWLERKMAPFSLVNIDPYRRVHLGKESDNTDMAALHNAIRAWSNRDGKTVNIIHHGGHDTFEKIKAREGRSPRIADWSRGATDLPGLLDCAFNVERGFGPDHNHIIMPRDGRFPELPPLHAEDLGGDGLDPRKDNGFAGFTTVAPTRAPRALKPSDTRALAAGSGSPS